MSRTSTLILLGILVILAPFTGFPTVIRSLLEVIFGACVLGIGFSLRAQEAERQSASKTPVPAVPAPSPEPRVVTEHHDPSPIA